MAYTPKTQTLYVFVKQRTKKKKKKQGSKQKSWLAHRYASIFVVCLGHSHHNNNAVVSGIRNLPKPEIPTGPLM
jgi:UDP-2,3-diacylglucosamine pyrophosphatase LpxH